METRSLPTLIHAPHGTEAAVYCTVLVLCLTRCRAGGAAGPAGQPAAGQRGRGRTRVPVGPHRGEYARVCVYTCAGDIAGTCRLGDCADTFRIACLCQHREYFGSSTGLWTVRIPVSCWYAERRPVADLSCVVLYGPPCRTSRAVQGACLKRKEGHRAAVRFMMVSADGSQVLTGSGDRQVRVLAGGRGKAGLVYARCGDGGCATGWAWVLPGAPATYARASG